MSVAVKTIPNRSATVAIGSCRGRGVTPSFSLIAAMTFLGFAPVRSILLMNAMRGMPYRFI